MDTLLAQNTTIADKFFAGVSQMRITEKKFSEYVVLLQIRNNAMDTLLKLFDKRADLEPIIKSFTVVVDTTLDMLALLDDEVPDLFDATHEDSSLLAESMRQLSEAVPADSPEAQHYAVQADFYERLAHSDFKVTISETEMYHSQYEALNDTQKSEIVTTANKIMTAHFVQSGQFEQLASQPAEIELPDDNESTLYTFEISGGMAVIFAMDDVLPLNQTEMTLFNIVPVDTLPDSFTTFANELYEELFV